ncbi:hypothetical protein [Adlercreutzia sp. ZJ304]|uniref:hypothetical protein n=1 Tax=Adlercreutzia sp. ZJ304 TaxID=2709791 RepID=UPI0013EC9DE7|nr:hypothetical protein [Adlercreutzia sp. ZJ304]
MADKADFKHIKVTKSDDDIVIVAGAVNADAKNVSDAPSKNISNASSASANVSANDVPSEKKKPTAKPKNKEYEQTSLADIEQSKMPLTQKIIIALAVIAIIVFAIWYVIF